MIKKVPRELVVNEGAATVNGLKIHLAFDVTGRVANRDSLTFLAREVFPERENIKANAAKASFEVLEILLKKTEEKLERVTLALAVAKGFLKDKNMHKACRQVESVEKGEVHE